MGLLVGVAEMMLVTGIGELADLVLLSDKSDERESIFSSWSCCGWFEFVSCWGLRKPNLLG